MKVSVVTHQSSESGTGHLGSPTVLVGPHPNVIYAAYLANALRPKLKFASIIGSYGWGGRMVEQITGVLSNVKVEVIEPVITKGFPKEEDFKAMDPKHKRLYFKEIKRAK